jgi:hypothetical protein
MSPWEHASSSPQPERSITDETGQARYPGRATAELEQLLGHSPADFNFGEYQATEAEMPGLRLRSGCAGAATGDSCQHRQHSSLYSFGTASSLRSLNTRSKRSISSRS